MTECSTIFFEQNLHFLYILNSLKAPFQLVIFKAYVTRRVDEIYLMEFSSNAGNNGIQEDAACCVDKTSAIKCHVFLDNSQLFVVPLN